MDWNVSFKILLVEIRIPGTSECGSVGDRVLKEVIKVTWGHMHVLTRVEDQTKKEKTTGRHMEKMAICKPRRETEQSCQHLDFRLLGSRIVRKQISVLSKPHGLWFCVTAATAACVHFCRSAPRVASWSTASPFSPRFPQRPVMAQPICVFSSEVEYPWELVQTLPPASAAPLACYNFIKYTGMLEENEAYITTGQIHTVLWEREKNIKNRELLLLSCL